MSSTFTYTITITNPGGTTGNAAGFVDNETLEQYFAGQPAVTGVTYDQAKDKKRGNLRHRQVCQAFETLTNAYPVDVTASNGTATTEPDSIDYQVTIVDASALYVNVGGTVYTGTDAIKQVLAAVLSTDQTHRCDVYSPAPVFNVIDDLVVGAISDNATMLAAITVVANTY